MGWRAFVFRLLQEQDRLSNNHTLFEMIWASISMEEIYTTRDCVQWMDDVIKRRSELRAEGRCR